MSNADETTIPSLCCLLGDRLKCTDSKESYQVRTIAKLKFDFSLKKEFILLFWPV